MLFGRVVKQGGRGTAISGMPIRVRESATRDAGVHGRTGRYQDRLTPPKAGLERDESWFEPDAGHAKRGSRRRVAVDVGDLITAVGLGELGRSNTTALIDQLDVGFQGCAFGCAHISCGGRGDIASDEEECGEDYVRSAQLG